MAMNMAASFHQLRKNQMKGENKTDLKREEESFAAMEGKQLQTNFPHFIRNPRSGKATN